MTTLPEPVATPLTIDPALLDPNPFQPKSRVTFTPDQLEDLISVKDLGFIQKPQVRMHSTRRGRYQIKVGHRRCAAWQLYRPGELIPVDLIAADDRAMFEHMIVENLRTDPTPVERAVMIRDYMQRFNVTQAQAAPLFGLKNQASISNLLKLLALPADVQPLVNPQQVPQRLARLLVRPGQIAPKEVADLAKNIAAADDDDKETIVENGLRDLLNRKAVMIGWHDFKTDWQPTFQLTIDGRQETTPACEACDLFLRVGNANYCTRKACHAAKSKHWPSVEMQRVSEKFGIPVYDPAHDARAAKALDYDYRTEARVKAWLSAKTRPDHLRLIINQNKYGSGHSSVLGTDLVLLATTDPHALDGPKKPEPKPDRSTESPAARAKRIEREEAEAELRRAERSAARRSRADVTWLVQQLTLDTAAQLKIEGGILEIAAQDIAHTVHVFSDWVELHAFSQSIHAHKDDATRKQYIVFRLLLNEIQSYTTGETYAWSRAIARAEEVVTRDLKLKLLPGWNKPPIHRTDSNCWACGTFTPGPAITGVDRAKGWTVSGSDGSVACSDKCRQKLSSPSPIRRGKG